MTTSYNYLAADRAAIRSKIIAQLSTSYMQANLTSNWRGWRDISQELPMGTAGTINAQAAGAIWHLQASRPPAPVGDIEAPWARDYVMIVYLRRQADPTDIAIVDNFDALLKTRLKDVFVSDPGSDFYDLSAPWSVQEAGDTYIDTAHALRLRMVN